MYTTPYWCANLVFSLIGVHQVKTFGCACSKHKWYVSITGKYPYHAALQSMKICMQTMGENGSKFLFYFLGHILMNWRQMIHLNLVPTTRNAIIHVILGKLLTNNEKVLLSLQPSRYILIIIEILGSQDLRIGHYVQFWDPEILRSWDPIL